MNNLLPVDQTVVLSLVTGLGSGVVAGCIELSLDRWGKRPWYGWDAAVEKCVLYGILWAFLFSFSAFMFVNTNTSMALIRVNQAYLISGPVASLLFPLTYWLSYTILDQLSSPND